MTSSILRPRSFPDARRLQRVGISRASRDSPIANRHMLVELNRGPGPAGDAAAGDVSAFARGSLRSSQPARSRAARGCQVMQKAGPTMRPTCHARTVDDQIAVTLHEQLVPRTRELFATPSRSATRTVQHKVAIALHDEVGAGLASRRPEGPARAVHNEIAVTLHDRLVLAGRQGLARSEFLTGGQACSRVGELIGCRRSAGTAGRGHRYWHSPAGSTGGRGRERVVVLDGDIRRSCRPEHHRSVCQPGPPDGQLGPARSDDWRDAVDDRERSDQAPPPASQRAVEFS